MTLEYGRFKQYDAKWNRINYNGSSNYGTAGCGPSSVSNIIYAINKKVNPLVIGKWMKKNGYAAYGNGTYHSGIPAALKAFGAKDVQEVSDMSKVWSLMKKGYVGVFLFRAGSRNGLCWTTSGHFCSATGYEVKNGNHLVRIFDSGGRDHDGWYSYEKYMKGLVSKVWLCRLEEPEPETYDGAYPAAAVSKGKGNKDDIKAWQTFLSWWGTDIDIDGVFGNDTKAKTAAFQKAYSLKETGNCNATTIKKAKEIGASEKH